MRKTNTEIETSNKELVHAIFPLAFKKPLIENFKTNVQYELAAFDTDISNYATYILNTDAENYAKNVFISVYEYSQIPFQDVVHELATTVIKIKENRPDIRFVIVFPVIVSENPIFKDSIKELVSNGVYDIHFFGEYTFNDIIDLLDNSQPIQALSYLFSQEELNEILALKGTPILKDDFKGEQGLHSINQKPEPVQQEIIVEEPIQSNPLPSISKNTSNKKIAFLGITRSVGTSFIVTNYATYLSKHHDVAVYENPLYEEHRTYLSDMFLFFEDEPQRQSLPLAIKLGVSFDNNKKYIKDHVTYYPVNYLDVPIFDFSTIETMAYTNSGSHEIKLYDMGYINHQELFTNKLYEKLDLFDEVVLVVDVLPTKFLPHNKALANLTQELTLRGVDLTVVLNQYEKNVSLSDFKVFDFNQLITVPTLDRKAILDATYKRKTAFKSSQQLAAQLVDSFKLLSNKIDIDMELSNEQMIERTKRSLFNFSFQSNKKVPSN